MDKVGSFRFEYGSDQLSQGSGNCIKTTLQELDSITRSRKSWYCFYQVSVIISSLSMVLKESFCAYSDLNRPTFEVVGHFRTFTGLERGIKILKLLARNLN